MISILNKCIDKYNKYMYFNLKKNVCNFIFSNPKCYGLVNRISNKFEIIKNCESSSAIFSRFQVYLVIELVIIYSEFI